MRRYETLIVLHPDLPEAQVRETLDRIRRLIEGMGAESVQLQEWGMRELAFAIRKQQRGFYVLVEYVAKPEVTRELERTLKIGDEFLRFVSVVVPAVRKVETPPKPRKARPVTDDAGTGVSDEMGQ